MCSARSKRSLEKKEEPVPSPSLSGLQRPPKVEHPSRKRTVSQSSTSLSSGTGSGKEGNHSTKSNSTSKHRKGDDKGRSTRDGKVGVSNPDVDLLSCVGVCLAGIVDISQFALSSCLPTVQTPPQGINCACMNLWQVECKIISWWRELEKTDSRWCLCPNGVPPFSVLSSSSKHWAPLHYIGPATSFSNLLPLQEKSSKSCDNQLAVPPLSTDGSKSQRSKLMFEDR